MKKLYDIGAAEPGSRLADNVILGEQLARCSAWQLVMRVTHLAVTQGKTLMYICRRTSYNSSSTQPRRSYDQYVPARDGRQIARETQGTT